MGDADMSRGIQEIKNIGLLWAKVPMFVIKSADVCIKEVRCFAHPEPSLKFFFEKNILHPTPKP